MKQIAAVFLHDTEYGARFINYLKQVTDISYDMVYFNECKAMEEYLNQHRVDLLITQDMEAIDLHVKEKIETIIQLVEDSSKVKKQSEQDKVIYWYQYQSMESILKYLKPQPAQIKEVLDSSQNQNHKKKIISIVTLEEPFQSDQFIYQIADEICSYRSSLFVDLTPFGAITDYLNSKAGGNQTSDTISDLIYAIKEEKEEGAFKVESYLRRCRSISFLPSVNYGVDVMELSKKDASAILNVLEQSNYDLILLHLAFLSEATVELLNRSQSILYLNSDTISKQMHQKIRKQLEQVLSPELIQYMHMLDQGEERDRNKVIKKIVPQLLEGVGCGS